MTAPVKYKGGIIRPTPQGTWRAEYNAAPNRPRATHKTLQAAKDWIDTLRADLASGIAPSTPQEAQDAAQARALLNGAATLTEAARHYIETRASITHKALGEALAEYLEIRDEDGHRGRSLATLRHKLNPLKQYAAINVADITAAQLRATLHGAAATRNGSRRYYSLFWTWAIAQGYTKQNPAKALTRAQSDDTTPNALTIPQVATLLTTAMEHYPDLIPRMALGLWMGIRSAELERITAADIRDGKVHLGPHITKTRDRRVLEMFPNLIQWLEAYPPQASLIVPDHYKRETDLRIAAGLWPWPHNALRDTFATNHLAAYQDPGKTAYYTRHSNLRTLQNHYIDLTTRDHAEIYFQLTPETVSKYRPKTQSTP